MKKKTWVTLLALAVLAVVFWLLDSTRLSHFGDEGGQGVPYASLKGTLHLDQLLVDFEDDATPAQIKEVERKYGLHLRFNSTFSKIRQLYRSAFKRPRGDVTSLFARLRQEPIVEHAEMDFLYSIPPLEHAVSHASSSGETAAGKDFPNDPKYRFQWHLHQIGMAEAWSKATGKGVIVAVIDTGVAFTSRGKFKQVPDLSRTSFVAGYDFVNDNAFPLDDHGHGTHVAGTIAQSTHNKVGVAGVAYQARIMPLKVLSARGFGSVADIAEAVRFAANHGAKVINMSLGGNRSSRILASAVKYAHGKGVVVVCAAGNDGQGKVGYPAAYPGAIAVAATQFDLTTTFYSNWGKAIDVAAPGGNTRVDQNGDGMPDGVLQNTIMPGHPDQDDYLLFMGTSMASPHVAGVAALIVQSGVSTPEAVERLLKSTAVHPQGKSRDDHYGAGIINAAAALSESKTLWGGTKLGLSSLLGVFILAGLRRKKILGLHFGVGGVGGVIGLVVASSGLFLLPSLGQPGSALGLMTTLAEQGFPSWGGVLLGPAWQGNPVLYSGLIPLALTGLLYGVDRCRGFLFGLSVGMAGLLLFHAAVYPADIMWIPNMLGLDQLWLVLNSLGCLLLASLIARK